MKKSDRISTFVAGLEPVADRGLDPRYTGYFTCFNAQQYYEAHDVLEDLWLQTTDENYPFFKGLIQFAGGYVHLQKQFLRPHHAKDGRRLRPATRLFRLAWSNLEPFRPVHWHLDVAELCTRCEGLISEIEASSFQRNPWRPDQAPSLHLMSPSE
jgi:hypothetical protein